MKVSIWELIFNPVYTMMYAQYLTEATKIKRLVIEQPITDLFNVNGIKKLDERPETCDWVAAYVTSSGLVARLCSYKPNNGSPWEVGFKYINPSSQGQKNQCYFECYNHIDAIKHAINNERDVMLFNNEAEFCAWYSKQPRNYSC